MLPGAPLPNRLPCRSYLGQVIRVHLAGLSLWSGSILARLHVAFGHPSGNAACDVIGYLGHAMQQHVAIAQQDAVMMVVPVAYFPQHFAIPVGFQDDAAFEREAAQKALL